MTVPTDPRMTRGLHPAGSPLRRPPLPAPVRWELPPPRSRPRHRSASAAVRASRNVLWTAVLLAAMAGLLVLVGSLFGRAGALVGLALGLAAVAGSYWFSDRLALRAAGAVPVGPGQFPHYRRAVAELCARSGLPVPRLYVIPARQPNAFATGRGPRHAAVAVTTGLLDMLTPRELRAVLAHELAHVGNRDVLLSSVAAALATGISGLAHLAGWLPAIGPGQDDKGPSPLGVLLAALLAPLAALLLQLALSRRREFEADRTGAALLGEGHTLATALAKIEYAASRHPMPVSPAQAGLYVVTPLTGAAGLAALFRTHPSTTERIARLTQGRPGNLQR